MTEFEKKQYKTGSVSMSLAIPIPLKEALEKMAEETGISRNKLIVSAIMMMIEKRRSHNEYSRNQRQIAKCKN